MTPETTLLQGVGAGLGTYILSKDVLGRVLGPTLDLFGEDLKNFVAEIRNKNTVKIVQNADKKLPEEKKYQGSVPSKVLKIILNDASFCDDELGREYFGGVLASSKTLVSRDDRAAQTAKLVDRLTAYQLRAHYILYATLLQLKINGKPFYQVDKFEKEILFGCSFPLQPFLDSMDFSKEENEQKSTYLQHIFTGLEHEKLIEDLSLDDDPGNYDRDYLTKKPKITFTPTIEGVALYLSAFGVGDKPADFFLDQQFTETLEYIMDISDNAHLIAKKNKSTDRDLEKTINAIVFKNFNVRPR